MTKNKNKNKVSTAIAVGLGLATLSGGAYYYFGPKGKKHQKEAKVWMQNMKEEVENKLKKAKDVSSKIYHNEVDVIADKYTKKYKDYANEIGIFSKNLKSEWKDAKKTTKTKISKQNNKKLMVIIVLFMFGFLSLNTVLAAGPEMVNLNSADNFTLLSKAGISTTGETSIIGNIGVSPVAATFITGFALDLQAGNPFSVSSLVSGKIYASDYSNPTPVKMNTAISDMEDAYTDAMGRKNPTATELGAGNIGGLTILPGLYKWGTSVTIPTDVTLFGNSNDFWIFQIDQNLSIDSDKKVILTGGAKMDNIFWVVAGKTTLGTTSTFNGNILDKTAIVLNTGARLNGRALAQTAVTLDSNIVNSLSSPVIINFCDYAAAKEGCNYVQGPNYNSITHCGMILNCTNSNSNSNVNSSGSSVVISHSVTFGQQVSNFVHSFKKGNRHNDVKILQQFLIEQNKGIKAEELKNGGIALNFGPLTKAALIEWQNVNGLVGDGICGPKTKAKIKDLNL